MEYGKDYETVLEEMKEMIDVSIAMMTLLGLNV